MEIAHKLAVLEKTARALNEKSITWAVGASLLLYFKGMTDNFRDIDLMVDEKDMPAVKSIFAGLGTPRQPKPQARFKTAVFLQYVIDGVDFDVMAGLVIVADGKEHSFSLKEEDITDAAELRGTTIPLQSVAAWREYYSLMGRTERVKLIDEKTLN